MTQSTSRQSIDDLTATLLIQLQLEDIEQILSCSKGKNRQGELTDTELALHLYKQDLECGASILSDRRMTKSIGRAVKTDADALAESSSQEQCAARDRNMACELSGTQTPSDVKPCTVTTDEMNDEHLARLEALWVSPAEENENIKDSLSNYVSVEEVNEGINSGESSLWAGARKGSKSSEKHLCTACQDDKKYWEVVRTPCSHE
jgi:hypothetical protein